MVLRVRGVGGWGGGGGGGGGGAENIYYKIHFSPNFAKHLHQQVILMGVGSCTSSCSM